MGIDPHDSWEEVYISSLPNLGFGSASSCPWARFTAREVQHFLEEIISSCGEAWKALRICAACGG